MSFKTVTALACLLLAFNAMNISTDFEDSPPAPKESPKPRPAPAFPFPNNSIPKIEPQPEKRAPEFPEFPFLNLPKINPREENRPESENKPAAIPFPFPDFPTPRHRQNPESERKPATIVLPIQKEEKTQDNGDCVRSLRIANEKIAELSKQLSQSRPRSEAEDLDALKSLVKKLETENAALKSKFGKLFETIGHERDEKKENNEDELIAIIAQKEVQIKKLTEDNRKLFADNRTFNSIIRKLTQDVEEALKSKAESDNSKIISENQSLRTQLATIEGRFTALQNDFDRLGKMSVEFIKVKKEFEVLSKERDELKDVADKNQKLMSDNSKLFQDNKLIAGQLAKLTKENEELKQKTEESKEFVAKFRLEIEELKKTITGLTIKLSIYDKAQNNEEEYKKQITEFKGIIAMLEKRIHSLENERKESRTQIETLRNEAVALQATINKQNVTIEDLRKRCPSGHQSSAPAITLPPILNHPTAPQRSTPSRKNNRNTFIGANLQNQDFE